MGPSRPSLPHVVGRYAVYGEIAAGGMATVHYGRLLGPVGFSRTVAIKRLHPQFAKDPEFASMFLDEARLAARIRHPNVVQTLDVVALDGELFLVLEYVQGESLARLMRAAKAREEPIPLPIVSAILCGALHGLHAAHEATSENGEPLRLVHRDVSPQNVLVGADGVSRVLDFGVAKAAGRAHTTREGQLKGKLAYMAPEQVAGAADRRTDVYAAGVVIWEALTSQRLFAGDNDAATFSAVMSREIPPPSSLTAGVPRALDEVCLRALERDVKQRFQTAREFALALEACIPPATPTRVAEWVEKLVGDDLSRRAMAVAQIESNPDNRAPPSDAEQHSQVSSVSLSTTPRRQVPSARRRMPVVYGVVLLIVGLLGTTALLLRRVEQAPRASSGAPAAPPSSSSEMQAPSVPVAAAPPSVTATTSGAIDATSAPAPARSQRAHRAAPPPAPIDCNPPWYLDSAGHRQYRPECL